MWQSDRLHVSDFIVGHLINTFLIRYGLTPSTEADVINHSLTPEEIILRRMTKEVDQYKDLSIRYASLLRKAGIDPD